MALGSSYQGPGVHLGPGPNLGLVGGVGHVIICGSRAATSESTTAA